MCVCDCAFMYKRMQFCVAVGIFKNLCVCIHLCIFVCLYVYELVHVSWRARLCECSLVDNLSAQVNLMLSGHTSGVCRPARRALSHQ